MKKNMMKRIALALCAAALLTALTACGGDTTALPVHTAAGAPSQGAAPSAPAAVGTVLLSVNPEIQMDYDSQGDVVALTGRNQDGKKLLAGYTGYAGRPCTVVVGELVDEINHQGYFDATIDGREKNIVLKLERGSQAPSDQFLNEMAEAVRAAVEVDHIGSQTVTLDQDDYDDVYGDKGYINAAAAEGILSAQLGRDDLQFVEKDYDLDDGDYEVEFILDGVAYEYEVDAFTGKVEEVEVDRPEHRPSATPAAPSVTPAATPAPAAPVYRDDDWDDDDRYDDDWDDDDRYDDDWDDDDRYDDDWDDDDRYDDDWDDDDRYDDDWDDDQYDDDWDDDDRYDDDWDDDDRDDDDWDDDDWDD